MNGLALPTPHSHHRTESRAMLLVARCTIHMQILFKIVAPLHAVRHWLVRVFSRWRLDFFGRFGSSHCRYCTKTPPRPSQRYCFSDSAVKRTGCGAEYTKRGYWHEHAETPWYLHESNWMASGCPGQLASGADGGQFPFFRVVTVAAVLESPWPSSAPQLHVT